MKTFIYFIGGVIAAVIGAIALLTIAPMIIAALAIILMPIMVIWSIADPEIKL